MGYAYDNWLTDPQDKADQAAADAQDNCDNYCQDACCSVCSVEGKIHGCECVALDHMIDDHVCIEETEQGNICARCSWQMGL